MKIVYPFRIRLRIWSLAAAALAIAGFCTLAGAIFCAATLHVQRGHGPVPPRASDVSILSGGMKLRAWWLQPETPDGKCVIVLHGIADSRASSAGFASMFLPSGYAVLAPDSRAHGDSGGRFVTYGLLEKYDVIAWTQWMRGRGCRQIFGLGESLGASILIEASALGPVFSAIAAECPYADLRQIAEYRTRRMLPLPGWLAAPAASVIVSSGMLYAEWTDGLDFSQASPLAAIRRSSTPTLLIHGLTDHETPPSNSLQLAAANRAITKLWLVPNAGHTGASSAAPEEFRCRVLGWFACAMTSESRFSKAAESGCACRSR